MTIKDSCGSEVTGEIRSADEGWVERTPSKITVENLNGPNCGSAAWTDNRHTEGDLSWKITAGSGVSCDTSPNGIPATWVVPGGYQDPALTPNQFATATCQASQDDCDDPGGCYPYATSITEYYWDCA